MTSKTTDYILYIFYMTANGEKFIAIHYNKYCYDVMDIFGTFIQIQ